MRLLNDQDKRRKYIFDLYSTNLHMLVENDIVKGIDLKYNKTYVCPICMRQFSEEALNQNSKNPLTLEDAPPKNVGGKAKVLTCKQCNNRCGVEIDSHLVVRMREIDNSNFLPDASFWGIMTNDEGIEVNVQVSINKDKVIKTFHNIKNNPPNVVEVFAESIDKSFKNGVEASRIVSFKRSETKSSYERTVIALLKTSYLMMFEEFGYLFIYEEVYKRVRNQIIDNDTLIYPMNGWFCAPPKSVLKPGVYFVEEKGMYCLTISFILKTKLSEKYIMSYLPLLFPIQYILKELNLKSMNSVTSFDIIRSLGLNKIEAKYTLNMKVLEYNKSNLNDLKSTKIFLQQINTLKQL